MSGRMPSRARAARGDVGLLPTSLIAHILLQYLMGLFIGRQNRSINSFWHLGFKQMLNFGDALGRSGYFLPARARRIFSFVANECVRSELFTIAAQPWEQYFFASDGTLTKEFRQPERSHRCAVAFRKKSILPLSQFAFVRSLCLIRYDAEV